MKRTAIPYEVHAEVFFRDRWLCSHCRRPTIFHLALRELSTMVRAESAELSLAYWDSGWSRDGAPLLDELAAMVDHIQPLSKGGPHTIGNFATICARCNGRKGTRSREEHLAAHKPWIVKGKRGEPTAWDGLSSVFVALAQRRANSLNVTERGWVRALKPHLHAPESAQ